ncbi:MAG: phosphoribosylamine--glycine ligase [Treponemataceae bacterium]|nr:phosphoribosylamine--glycine ligase [Treponemataceae bacterium]
MQKIIVIGSGGREHAIAWRLAQSDSVEEILCAVGNGGTCNEKKCRNVPLPKSDANGENTYVEIAKKEKCTLAVIGPEDPLAEGLADEFWAAGIPCVGAKKAAAQLEASKDFAKAFMKKYRVASAESETFCEQAAVENYIKNHGAPIVIKADGLAAGKGVVVAKTLEQALAAVDDIMNSGRVGSAGKKIVVEDYLSGIEMSVLAAVSVDENSIKKGTATIVPFLPARDHKRLNDGAKGPNTGGMGAVCPLPDVTPEIMKQFEENILRPTLDGLIAEKFDYRGFIFFGVMITPNGPKLLEYNVRLGDPETQAVFPLMDFDFAKMCEAIAQGNLNEFKLNWKKEFAVAPVVVSGGYPGAYNKGVPISIDENILQKNGAKIFVAGAVEESGAENSKDSSARKMLTSGGRVLAVCTTAETFDAAWKKSYDALEAVKFDGMFFRKDIGLPGAAVSE